METGERVADLARDVERCAGREPSLVTEDRAKRRSLDVLHDEIRPALLASLQHAHDVGVQHRAPDLLLALESRKRYHVDLVLQVWDLQRNGSARPRIDCLEDRRHSSARDHVRQAVPIEKIADGRIGHPRRAQQRPCQPAQVAQTARIRPLSLSPIGFHREPRLQRASNAPNRRLQSAVRWHTRRLGPTLRESRIVSGAPG